MLNDDFSEWSIHELGQHIEKKDISPVEVMKQVLEKMDKENTQLNAFIAMDHDKALQQAKKAELDIMQGNYKGPLHGIPVGIKDLIHMKGFRTTCGTKLMIKEGISNFNAEVVERLHDHGAIIIGKENMHTLAYGSTGDVSHFGPVKNPLNINKITGGSSSGSAAAVASNISYGSIGSDTGGSIRIPAACCGVVGMKPTFGLVSRYGVVSLAPTLDTLGPLTRNVLDNAMILEAIASYDEKDSFSSTTGKRDYRECIYQKNTNLVIGIPRQFYFDLIDDEIKESFDKTIEKLRSNGYQIKFIDLPYMEEIDAALSVIFAAEVYESLEHEIHENPQQIEAEIRTRILEGYFVKAHEYIKMFRVKNVAIETFTKVLHEVDVIMTPTICAYPCNIGEREATINGEKVNIRKVYSRLVRASNLTGFPAISLPTDKSSEGFFNSIQLIGLPFDEKQLYNVAFMIEQLY